MEKKKKTSWKRKFFELNDSIDHFKRQPTEWEKMAQIRSDKALLSVKSYAAR